MYRLAFEEPAEAISDDVIQNIEPGPTTGVPRHADTPDVPETLSTVATVVQPVPPSNKAEEYTSTGTTSASAKDGPSASPGMELNGLGEAPASPYVARSGSKSKKSKRHV